VFHGLGAWGLRREKSGLRYSGKNKIDIRQIGITIRQNQRIAEGWWSRQCSTIFGNFNGRVFRLSMFQWRFAEYQKPYLKYRMRSRTGLYLSYHRHELISESEMEKIHWPISQRLWPSMLSAWFCRSYLSPIHEVISKYNMEIR